MSPIEQQSYDSLRKQAADREDLHSLNLLDIAEQLALEEERQVIAILVSSRVKNEAISEFVCKTMVNASVEAMKLMMILGLVKTKKEA